MTNFSNDTGTDIVTADGFVGPFTGNTSAATGTFTTSLSANSVTVPNGVFIPHLRISRPPIRTLQVMPGPMRAL